MQHTRGQHDAGGETIHDTPKETRRKFAAEIWSGAVPVGPTARRCFNK